jgi:hypothetical protein
MRILRRLIVLTLAGYGAWSLYERYGARLSGLSEPAKEFSQRATSTAQSTADRLRGAGTDAAESLKSAAAELDDAATEASTSAMRTLQTGDDREPTAAP